MPFQPEKITKQHVLKAIELIDSGKYEVSASTGYDVVINGKKYPPKELMRFAHEQATGEYLWNLSGGQPTNKYLEAMGFEIVNKSGSDPWGQIIDEYKAVVAGTKNTGEVYKWKFITANAGRLNPNAPNFEEQLRSVNFLNLVYHNGAGVLFHLLREYPNEVQECFVKLFNESKPLANRVADFYNETLSLYRRIEPKLSHHQDERSIATYLTIQYPDRYTFYKNSFYKKLCERLNIKAQKKLKKYVHYLELIKEFVSKYVNKDEELLQIKRNFLTNDCYPDDNNLILVQDILYQVLDHPGQSEVKYWRIGTTIDDEDYLPEMLKDEVVAIGWSALGDLDSADIKNRKDVIELLDKAKYTYKSNSSKSRKAGEILSFYESVRVGDIVLAQEGDTVKAIAEITDDYLFNPVSEAAHTRAVRWLNTNPLEFSSSEGRNTTFVEITSKESIDEIKKHLDPKLISKNEFKTIDMSKSLNTIMYGPPGTGKTYNTIEKAIRLANPAYVFPNTGDKVKDREEIKKEFDRLKKLGQVYFTTFHQSLSYEDFIEGIKPLPPVPGQSVQYDVVPGLFKQACAMAAHNCYNEYIKSNKSDTDYTFDDLYDAFITDVEALLEKNTPPVYKTIQGRDVEIKEINKNDSIIARAKDSIAKQSAPLTKENIQKLYDRFETIEEIKGLDEVRDTVQITPRITEFYAVFRGLKDFEKTFKPNTEYIKEVNISENFDVDEIQKKFDGGVYNEAMKAFGQKALPVVFVIDEINRGNVSQIFGELITLIEDDKRAGRQEALEAKLPYSKKYFSVPANLYIVGTMNTADRSVEALDTALRRRFAFEEKMPEPKLLTGSVKDISLESLLIKINERVELLLDRDHTIGHSYFITVKDEVELKLAFKNKILPLLQEYFYGDYGKIGLVLGTGFVNDNVKPNKTPFAPFKYPNGSDQFVSQKCELIPINDDFKIIEAVKTLMSN
jgi:hypothetical protein